MAFLCSMTCEALLKLQLVNVLQTLYNAALENNCSEQASRMAAMESSTKNASEMLGKLTLSYNRSAFPQCLLIHSMLRVVVCLQAVYLAVHIAKSVIDCRQPRMCCSLTMFDAVYLWMGHCVNTVKLLCVLLTNTC